MATTGIRDTERRVARKYDNQYHFTNQYLLSAVLTNNRKIIKTN